MKIDTVQKPSNNPQSIHYVPDGAIMAEIEPLLHGSFKQTEELLDGLEGSYKRERRGRLTAERMVRWMGVWILFQAGLLMVAAFHFWPAVTRYFGK